MEKEIKNKIVVITGASRGIGYATANVFLLKGAKNIVILDINEELGLKATDTLNEEFGKGKVKFFKCDVTSDVEAIFNKILDTFKTFDVLVNNAGVLDENSIRTTIAVNTVATVEWTMKFWEHARKDKGGNGGTVINIASIYGYMVDPLSCFYKCSKYAVVGFTRTIGHKINYEQTGVRIVAVCPTFTKTDMTEATNIALPDTRKFQTEFISSLLNKVTWLEPPDISNGIAEIFEKADSGTVWTIIGGDPIKEVPVPPEFHSDYLIQTERRQPA